MIFACFVCFVFELPMGSQGVPLGSVIRFFHKLMLVVQSSKHCICDIFVLFWPIVVVASLRWIRQHIEAGVPARYETTDSSWRSGSPLLAQASKWSWQNGSAPVTHQWYDYSCYGIVASGCVGCPSVHGGQLCRHQPRPSVSRRVVARSLAGCADIWLDTRTHGNENI